MITQSTCSSMFESGCAEHFESGPVQMRYGAGSVIDERYVLTRMVGSGGCAQVWAAHSQLLGNEVAVKIFVRRNDRDFHASERMLREARAAAALEHSAVIRVFDFGTTHFDDPYVVMELLDGENLDDMLRRSGRLSGRSTLRLLLPIVEALELAHAKGIIHRDIKLANIVIARDGDRIQPKLIDFGLAKPRNSRRLTQDGQIVGTPAYMSPEHARGDELDARADIWSLSVALYELLAGVVPFDAPSVTSTLRAVRESDPKELPRVGDVDEELVKLVMKGLAKETSQRWASMRELGLAMARWLHAHGVADDARGCSLESTWLRPSALPIVTPSPIPVLRLPSRNNGKLIGAIATGAVLGFATAVVIFAPSPEEDESMPPAAPIVPDSMELAPATIEPAGPLRSKPPIDRSAIF